MDKYTYKMRVCSFDTDCFGMVHHSNYLRFMEVARTEWLRDCGHELDDLAAQEIVFVIHSTQLEFTYPAKYNEELEIVTWITRRGRASVTYQQMICKFNNDKTLVCKGQVKVACVDNNQRPRMIPDFLISSFAERAVK